MARELQPVADVLPVRSRGCAVANQKVGERQQPVAIVAGADAADRAATLRADEGEVLAGAGRGTFGEVETEADLSQKQELVAHEGRAPAPGARRRLDRREQTVEGLV